MLVTLLAGAAVAALGLGVALLLLIAAPGPRARMAELFRGRVRHPLAWAWMVACVATAGSLYLSEVVGFVPCVLCWYQRIAMYPLVVVLGVGTLRGEGGVWRYAMPLPVLGLLVAAYHVTIQWQPALDVGVCSAGASCTGRYLSVFGFVSIPVMAGAAFLLLIGLLLLVRLADAPSGLEPGTDALAGRTPDVGAAAR